MHFLYNFSKGITAYYNRLIEVAENRRQSLERHVQVLKETDLNFEVAIERSKHEIEPENESSPETEKIVSENVIPELTSKTSNPETEDVNANPVESNRNVDSRRKLGKSDNVVEKEISEQLTPSEKLDNLKPANMILDHVYSISETQYQYLDNFKAAQANRQKVMTSEFEIRLTSTDVANSNLTGKISGPHKSTVITQAHDNAKVMCDNENYVNMNVNAANIDNLEHKNKNANNRNLSLNLNRKDNELDVPQPMSLDSSPSPSSGILTSEAVESDSDGRSLYGGSFDFTLPKTNEDVNLKATTLSVPPKDTSTCFLKSFLERSIYVPLLTQTKLANNEVRSGFDTFDNS